MKSITELFTSKAIAAYWKVMANQRAPYFGESKFPAKKKLGLDLSWIKGARKAPVQLSLSAFDAKAIPLNRGTVDKMSTDMPFFKNSMNIDEKQRQELNKVIGNENNKALVDILVNDIFNDKMHLLEYAALTREVMRMQVLTTGALTLASNGQNYSYDFGVPNANKVTPTVAWDVAATADPIADITAWLDQIENATGVRPTEGVMNSVTLSWLTKCAALKNAIYVLGEGKATPTKAKVLEFIQNETQVKFYIDSKTYDDNGTSTKFIADGTVVLFPETPLGNTWFGTTPEESDLMSGEATDAQVSIVDTGVAITTTKQTDPVNVMTKVSMICLPSFEMAEQVIIASVATAG